MAQWWDDRELRILVLASLVAQYFLLLFAGIRKFHISPWLRFSFRLAHIGSDALAIFALATLFNRHRGGPRCSYAPGSRDMELLWAPILLLHLGGQVVITTYKIEDNEQSTRYILTSLSKVTVALYVFYKTWSSDDKRLLAAMVLLFILVIIRCFQKALYLKSGSFSALRKASSSEASVVRRTDVREDEQPDKFIQEARGMMNLEPRAGESLSSSSLLISRLLSKTSKPYKLFLDFPCSYSDRLEIVRYFRLLDRESGFESIEGELSAMTSFLYTKDDAEEYLAFNNVAKPTTFRMCTHLLAQATLMVVFYLVSAHVRSVAATRHKKIQIGEAIGFTVVLLSWTFLLEVICVVLPPKFRDKFSGRILQHSLIGLLVHKRRHSTLRSIAGWLQCKDLLDGFWRPEPSNSCKEITELVRLHVETGWKEYMRDPHTYRMFNDTRGEWTLARNRCLPQLGWSTRGPVDESIVLWHLATDFCFHHTDRTSRPDDHVSARQCKEMSNYMVHLLFDNPEMLMPGSRKRLLELAYEEIEVLLNGEGTLRGEGEVTRKAFQKCQSAARSIQDTAAPTLIGDAWKLAQTLLSLDETKIWELIKGVWVEMLCFSASRCRGYLHAEALGTGVEYLSYVWVLLARTGMETFSEKLLRRECHPFDSNEYWGFGLARERGGNYVTFTLNEVAMDLEEIRRRQFAVRHCMDGLLLARERGDNVTFACSAVTIELEEIERRVGVLRHYVGLVRESGDVFTPLASQSEITQDVVLEV